MFFSVRPFYAGVQFPLDTQISKVFKLLAALWLIAFYALHKTNHSFLHQVIALAVFQIIFIANVIHQSLIAFQQMFHRCFIALLCCFYNLLLWLIC